MHGMPIACVLGEDNKERQQNKPDDETIEYWEKLKNLGGITPKFITMIWYILLCVILNLKKIS